MTPEQIGLLVLFAVVGLVNWLAQVLRRRQQPPSEATPAPVASAPPPAAPPPVARSRPTVSRSVRRASRTDDTRRLAPEPRRTRPRFTARELRHAVVLSVVLAPPGGLERAGVDRAGAT